MSAPRKINNLLWGLVAIALGVSAQSCLARNHAFSAGILYVVAVIFIIYALRRHPGPVAPAMPASGVRFRSIAHRLGLASVALAGLLTVLALRQFAAREVPLSAWLLYSGSLALLVTAAFSLDRGQAEVVKERLWSRTELGLFLLIFAVAAFMRLYRFDQFPFGTWYDEADNGLYALRILEDSHYRPVYVESTNLPAHYLYLVAISFHLLGATTLAIRAVSVAMGLATVAAAYLTGRELFGRRMGLVLAFLLAVSRWNVNFSRIGVHGVSTPLFELLATGFLLRGLRRQRFTDFTWAGLSLGLGLCFYASFRLFPLVMAFFLLHQFVVQRGFLRRHWMGLLVFGLVAVIAVAPAVQFAFRQPEVFWARARQTSVFTGKTREQGWQAVKENVRKHLLMFNYRGDPNGRHNLPGEPMLDPVSGALMVLGVGLCLLRGRHPRSLLLPIWLGVMLCPGIFSLDFEAPQSLRAIGSLPVAYLLAVVPLEGLWREWERGIGQRRTGYFVCLLLLLSGQIGYTNYQIYFYRQARDFASWNAFSTAETITGHILAELGDSVEFHVISLYHNHPTVRFLARNVTQYHRFETNDSLPLRQPAKKDVVLILDLERQSVYGEAQRYYPRATFKEYKPPFEGPTVLYFVRLTQADITDIQGLEGSYYHGNDWTGEPALIRQDASLRFDWRDGVPLLLPFSVEWKGILSTARYGPRRLILYAPDHAELYLDETLLLKGKGEMSTEVTLARGNHALRLRAIGAEGHFELMWQLPGEEQQAVPSWSLYVPPMTNNGLLGNYYPNSEWRPPIALAQIDPRLNLYFHTTPLPRPYTVEWQGKIFIPQDGRYVFGLESIDESVLYIDGREVTASPLPNQYQERSIHLTKGLHDIHVRFTDRTDHTHIYLYWIPPGGNHQIVPAEVLFPPQGSYEQLTLPSPSVLRLGLGRVRWGPSDPWPPIAFGSEGERGDQFMVQPDGNVAVLDAPT